MRAQFWTWVQGQPPFPRRTKDWREGERRATILADLGSWARDQVQALSFMGAVGGGEEFQPMELEAEEQNEPPITKTGEGSWSRTSSKLASLLSFFPSTNICELSPMYHLLC